MPDNHHSLKTSVHGIDMGDISRFRGELMGAAMLFVMLFHVGMPRSEMMYALHRCGNVGVDMFLFLSGIGLWYSWTGKGMNNLPQTGRKSLWFMLRRFYWRRYIRVYPAWLIVACLFYIPAYMSHPDRYTPDIYNLVANITVNWSFWRIDDLRFWFIPAIMLMYTFAPLYMMLIQRCPSYRWLPVVFIVWAVMVYYYPPVHSAVGHVEIFWSRIPIFLIGINCGSIVKRHSVIEPQAIWLIILLFTLSLMMCLEFEESWRGHFPLFIERMVYIPLTITAILLLTCLLRHFPSWTCRMLTFVGALSLETYLVHIEFVLRYLKPYRLGYAVTSLSMIAISLTMAWLLHKAVNLLTAKIKTIY